MLRRFRRDIRSVLALAFLAAAGTQLSGQSSTSQQEAGREAWQRVPEILAAMAVADDAVVADVGAGDGFLTTRLARAVGPDGRVFAVDITDRAVERLRARVRDDGLTNVTVVKGDADDPHLAAASLDAAVIINAYHEMVDHQAMLRKLREALKRTGRLVIIEPISQKLVTDGRERQVLDHEIAARFVEQEARDAGFHIEMLQDPFTRRSGVAEWLILAVPTTNTATADAPTAAAPGDPTAESNSDLRIAFDSFTKRRAEGSIVVVDVRSEEEFVAGHIPGAVLAPLSELNTHIERLRALRKPIVTYCS